MFSGHDCAVAPPSDYVVFPSLDEGRDPSVILHHYVAESKRAYFQYTVGSTICLSLSVMGCISNCLWIVVTVIMIAK